MSRLRPRLISESARLGVSVGALVVVSAVGGVVAGSTGDEWRRLPTFAASYFAGWSIYCVLYFALTLYAFRSLTSTELRTVVEESDQDRRRRRRRETLASTGGTSGSVAFCAFTIAAVIAAAVIPELRESTAVISLAAVVVASSWLYIVTAYAMHYVRENSFETGLAFPGSTGHPVFSDYWYFAVQVSTSFTSADVSVTTSAMRREVTAHSIVAFVFNTLTIALLVSLLITAIT